MPERGPNWAKQKQVAIHLAQGKLTDREIARHVPVPRSTLHTWKKNPRFQALVREAQDEINAEALKLPIADKQFRVETLNDLVTRQLEAIRLRAARHAVEADSPAESARRVFGSSTPPEAATGLFVAQPKISARGDVVTEWAYDSALTKSLMDALKQAGIEVGNFNEGTTDTKNINITVMAKQVIEELGADVEVDEVHAELMRLRALSAG